MEEIDTPRLGAFVGRYRPNWGRAWEGGYIPEFGLLVAAEGGATYRVAGEGRVLCRQGTLLVRRYDEARGLLRSHIRFTTAGRWPFVYAHTTPLCRAVERCVWQA